MGVQAAVGRSAPEAEGYLARAARIGWLRRSHDAFVNRIRSSRWATRALFGVEPAEPGIIHWDYTSLMIHRAVCPMLRDGMRVWDLGCGPEALVTRYLRRRADVEVVASDADLDSVNRARRAVAGKVPVVHSDLGEAITGRFDLVLFNAPYLPLGAPELLPPGLPLGPERESFQRRLGGGRDGIETMRRFLGQVRAFLAPGGRALLGWNRYYVPYPTLLREIDATAGLRRTASHQTWWNPSVVVILEAA
jgi:SAM-dependent methyltransferase